LIQLDEVGRTYGSGPGRSIALDGVSLRIGKGEFVAVAGPSGSGKTTLLNLIAGIDLPTRGRIAIEGRDLSGLGEREQADLRLRKIGFIFQHFNLIPVLSAAENVELPLLFRRELSGRQRGERVEASLRRVGLEGKRARRPADLSGGERQRVAVARALAGDPEILLADEPTANLDHETGGAMIKLMHDLNRERETTFLYATHDQELIRMADRVVTLRDGRLSGPAA